MDKLHLQALALAAICILLGTGWKTLLKLAAVQSSGMSILEIGVGGLIRKFLVAPFWPASYAVFERKSPMWEIFSVFPGSEAFQQTEIKRISEAAPKFGVINDHALNSRDDLRFENTHPSIYRCIQQNFEPVEEPLEAIQLYVYRSKPVAP